MREETSFVDSTNFKIIINYKITNCLQLRFDNSLTIYKFYANSKNIIPY